MDKTNLLPLYGGFKRLGNFSIDPSSIFENIEDMKNYIENDKTAHNGQQLAVYGGNENDIGVYLIISAADNKYKKISQDEKLIERVTILENTVNKLSEMLTNLSAVLTSRLSGDNVEVNYGDTGTSEIDEG